jgi:2-polyprenyl-3-methyl-5-hydroxy-6-metoxy-1,4-benzoquinol methylase
MDSPVYKQIYDVELNHWWFDVRRQIIEQTIGKNIKKPVTSALDIGCGTGLNAIILRKFSSTVTGLDRADEAMQFSALRMPDLKVSQAYFPETAPEGAFDLITMFDVLEHLEDDHAALRRVESMLNPGGYYVLTVPAFGFLWTEHDRVLQHFRRYTKKTLLQTVREETGLELIYFNYFNTLLFSPILGFRLLRKIFHFLPNRADDFSMPGPLNGFLKRIFTLDRWLMNYAKLPFGVSIICVFRKPTH